ncbi:MAG: cupin-like domain-containing protein [Nannocystaceae bacterium]
MTTPSINPRPVPRVSVDELRYVDFVRRFVMTGTPVILTGFGGEGVARRRWSLDYFREHLDLDEVVIVQMERASGIIRGQGRLGAVLSKVGSADPERDYKIYLSSWSFSSHNPRLSEDYEVPSFFDLDRSADLGLDLNWIYIGEDGTGSSPHLDTIASSAWLQLFTGEKHWRFLHQDEHEEFVDESNPKSLFDLVPAQLRPGSRFYAATQHPGEIMWTPSGLVHEVRNSFCTIAVTHNYVDATNIVEVLDDSEVWDRDDSAAALEGDKLPALLRRIWAQTAAQQPEAWPMIEGFVRSRARRATRPGIRDVIFSSLS